MFRRKAVPIGGNAAISELKKMSLGGCVQWIYMRGTNKTNPVLLILHGGPGTGQIGFCRHFQAELEKDFVVVNWDQRGAGLSYSREVKPESMTIRQMAADTLELTRYLCERFKQNSIYLLAHSWGTILGMLAISEQPSLFKKYFGVAQVANYMKNEQLSYHLVVERAKAEQHQEAWEELTEIGPPPWNTLKKDRIHQKYVELFRGGISHDGKLLKEILHHLMRSKEYTLFDVIRHLRGQHFSMTRLQEEMRSIDFQETITSVAVPIIFCMGRHDLMIPHQPTEAFFHAVTAPEKDWVWFENSAHTPIFEEKDKFAQLLREKIKKDT